MNKKLLFTLWGGLFILCAACGFIPEPEGALQIAMTLLAAAFFLPPAVLLYQADREESAETVKLVRNLAGASLLLTAAALVLNFVFALGSVQLGDSLYYVLVIVSSPMVCSGYWALSLFLWACLLMVSLNILRKK